MALNLVRAEPEGNVFSGPEALRDVETACNRHQANTRLAKQLDSQTEANPLELSRSLVDTLRGFNSRVALGVLVPALLWACYRESACG